MGVVNGNDIYKTPLGKTNFPAGTVMRFYNGLTSLQNYKVDFGFTNRQNIYVNTTKWKPTF